MATPRLGRCTATQKSPDCDGDLRDAQTLQLPAAHPPAVVAQQRVYDVIAQRCASFGVYAEDSAVARGFLSDLRALASRVLAHAKCNGVTDTSDEELIATYLDQQPPRAAAWLGRQYTSSKEPPKKTAAETAVSITAALKILGAETIADAAAAMKWLVPPCGGAGQKPAGFSAGLHASPIGAAIYIKAFSTELGPALQLRHRSNLAIPGAKRTDPAIAELLARRIPPHAVASMGSQSPTKRSAQISCTAMSFVRRRPSSHTNHCSAGGGTIGRKPQRMDAHRESKCAPPRSAMGGDQHRANPPRGLLERSRTTDRL